MPSLALRLEGARQGIQRVRPGQASPSHLHVPLMTWPHCTVLPDTHATSLRPGQDWPGTVRDNVIRASHLVRAADDVVALRPGGVNVAALQLGEETEGNSHATEGDIVCNMCMPGWIGMEGDAGRR